MEQKEEKAFEPEIEKARESISYDIGKTKAIIIPTYNEKAGKPLCAILLDIMQKDAENLCK
jgi:hypothetical protein